MSRVHPARAARGGRLRAVSRESKRYCPVCQAGYNATFERCVIDGAELTAETQDPNIGRLLAGRYRLVELLGSGGIGAVYRAHHEAAGRELAVKLLHARRSSPASRERFLREARITGRLSHPNIVEVYDAAITEDGTPYLVMELLRGEPLSQRLRRGAAAGRTGLEWVLRTANALSYAHEHGVIHRDIKPANVMVEAEDRLKVVDFGLALAHDEFKLTDTGALLGTPAYMSPEQLYGERASGAFDVYALGVVLYEVLTGKLPRGGSLLELRARAMSDPPERPTQAGAEAHAEIDQLAVDMRAVSGERRPTMKTVAQILRRHVGLEAESGAPPRTLAGEELRWARWLSLASRLLNDAYGSQWPPELRSTFHTAQDALQLLADGVAPDWDEQTLTVHTRGPLVPSPRLKHLFQQLKGELGEAQLSDGVADLLAAASALARDELREGRSPDPRAISDPNRALFDSAELLHRWLHAKPELQRLLPHPTTLVSD